MNKIDWYYIYSPRYYAYDLYLKDAIPDCFTNKGVFIEQHVFDEHLYKHEGEHFFSRITIKVETILKIITEKLEGGDSRPFFFTDVDIVVNSRAAKDLWPYTEKEGFDMFFQQEHMEGEMVNPGIILIWPTLASQIFWKSVLQEMIEKKNMEMNAINTLLKITDIHSGRFSLDHVISSITVNIKNLHTHSVYHLLTGSVDRLVDMNEKIVQTNLLGIDMNEYFKKVLEKYGVITN